jgi:hypothetical protein
MADWGEVAVVVDKWDKREADLLLAAMGAKRV